MIAVPTPMCLVTAATHVMVVTASEPYASADHTEWKPSRSASCTIGTSILSAEPEYPMFKPRRMSPSLTTT